MAHGIAALSSERHYMGSFTSGSYATDRNVRPDYDTRPTPATRMRWAANEPANRTRYLREFDALGCVIDCREAKEELAAIDARIAHVQGELARLGQNGQEGQPVCSEESRLACAQTAPADKSSELNAALEALLARREAALDTRRQLSSQLRLMGISPKDEARIWQEFCRQESLAS